MGDQPVTKAEFDGLIAAAKALSDHMVALITTTAGLTAKVDNHNNTSTTTTATTTTTTAATRTTTETIQIGEEDQFQLLGFVITSILLLCTKNQNISVNLI